MAADPLTHFLQPLLFEGLGLDPEWASRRVLGSLALLQHQPWARQQLRQTLSLTDPRLETRLWGIPFPNPVGLAAGLDKDGLASEIWGDLGFGFAELGAVTAHAQPGNPRPRLFRLPQDQAALNRMGFNNQGSIALATRLAHRKMGIPLGINLGKSKITPLEAAAEDYRLSFERLHPWADYFVINVSSPNTPGLRDLQTQSHLASIITALQHHNHPPKPLLIKIAPDLTWEQIDEILAVIQSFKLDGIIATNTTLSRSGLKTQHIKSGSLATQSGGISGAPLRARSTEIIGHLYRQTQGSLPIIGVGGIFTAADAWEKITAGASLVQVYTGWIYEGPRMVRQILQGLLEQLEKTGLGSLSDAVGLAHR